MKQVLEFNTALEASFAAGLLESRGIICEIRNAGIPMERGFGTPAPMAPSLWVVDDADFPRALEALRDTPDASGRPWSCPKCKSENEPQFDACWSCGTERSNP